MQVAHTHTVGNPTVAKKSRTSPFGFTTEPAAAFAAATMGAPGLPCGTLVQGRGASVGGQGSLGGQTAVLHWLGCSFQGAQGVQVFTGSRGRLWRRTGVKGQKGTDLGRTGCELWWPEPAALTTDSSDISEWQTCSPSPSQHPPTAMWRTPCCFHTRHNCFHVQTARGHSLSVEPSAPGPLWWPPRCQPT